MQKTVPSLGRILVMVGFALSCFGLLLFLWLAFGGPIPLKPKGYRFDVSFREAGQLAQEADVRISGVSVGKVKTIKADKRTGLSDATIELQRRYAPIPRDSRAILRQKTLLGETYVELTPGHKSSGMVPENGSLPPGQVAQTVELDEIFRAFDEKTRTAFRSWMEQLAVASAGRGRDISDALGNLAPFAQDTSRLLEILNAQQPEVRNLVSNTGVVFSALTQRDAQLRSLIQNSNRVFQTTADRNRELQQAFIALPTFEHESELTLNRLTDFSRKTNPLVTQLRPAARQLSPTLKDLSALAPDLKALFRDLDPLITASKTGLPALQRFTDELHPLLAEFDPPLRQLNPALEGLGSYKSELSAFFANVVGATQAKTPNGVHYLRTTNPLNLENLAVYPRRLPTNRPNPYAFPQFERDLKDGLNAYETRQCANGLPTIATDALTLPLIPQALQDNILKFTQANSPTAPLAPPCKQQPKYPVGGELTQYPHVKESTGATARAKRP
jgi:virulence factor Mce-like protein